MPRCSLAAIAALVLFATSLVPCDAAQPDPSVAAFLARSASAWNRGDLDAFMRGYENAPSTVYLGAKGVIRGYAAIRAHYARRYRAGAMGVLGFSDLSVRALGADYAVVLARYHVALADGTHPTGPFSLVLHRTAAGWRIIEDCTP